MVLAPIVALGAALRWSRWPRFALGIGTVAFFVTPAGARRHGLFLDDLEA